MWLICAALLWLFENNAATLALLIASVVVPLLSVAAAVHRSKSAELTAQARGTDLTVRVKGTGLFALAAGDVSCENRLTGEQTQAELRFPPALSPENPTKNGRRLCRRSLRKPKTEAYSWYRNGTC